MNILFDIWQWKTRYAQVTAALDMTVFDSDSQASTVAAWWVVQWVVQYLEQ